MNEKLQQFIQELPAEDGVKQSLLERLAGGEEQSVKEDIVQMLRQAGLALSAMEALDSADAGFAQTMQTVESQAQDLVSAVQKGQDSNDLEEVRKKLS
jgi:hypothetical protein